MSHLLHHKRAIGFAIYACLGAVLYGYDGVYFSGVQAMVPFVRSFGTKNLDGTYSIKPTPLAVMTSMINVGELVGTLGAAFVNTYAGRKATWLICSVLVSAGCVLQVTTNSNQAFILGGRVILGVGVGGFAATGPLYIGEIAPDQFRGPMLVLWQLSLSASQILAASINRGISSRADSFSWRFSTAFQITFPVIIVALMWWIPESPRWLLRKGRRNKCLASLARVHADDKSYTPEKVAQELRVLQAGLDAEMAAAAEGAWLDLVRNPIERRKVFFSAGALIAQQINGIQWFYYFGTVFSKDIGLSDPFLMTVLVFTIQLAVVASAMFFANRIPRRPLMLSCSCIMMVSIFLVGCLGIPSPGTTVSPTYGKVIITFVIVEIVAFNFSWGPHGWAMASEYAVGPNRNRIFAISVVCFWLTVWVTVFTLPYLYYDANLGAKTGFVYTGLCFLTVGYAYFCVGELRGRTIEDIEGFFREGIPARRWKDQPTKSHLELTELEKDPEKNVETIEHTYAELTGASTKHV